MRSNWTSVKLGNITTESTLRSAKTGVKGPVFGVERMAGLTKQPRYVSEQLDRYKIIKPGMFAYNPMRLNIGSIGYCDDSISAGLVSPDYVVFACKDILSPEFLSYFIQSSAWNDWVMSAGTGSVRTRIYFSELAKMPLLLPALSEQMRIAATLRSIDNKIEVNRRINTTLESMAQAIFKSWFVDFDPVNAKMEGRIPDGMNEVTASLFPDSFGESEMGLIPKGWDVTGLDGIATYLNGLALQKFPPEAQAWLPVIKIAQLRKGDTIGADRASCKLKPEYIVHDGDVLFSWSGSLEVEIWCGGDGALNQHLFKVTSPTYPKWFYYYWTKHHLEHFREVAAGKATTMGHIQRGHLSAAKVCVPSSHVMSAASNVLEPIVEAIIGNTLEANRLASLRDALLPRLISGQLRVPETDESTMN